jgi:broad specificity phosphatase PhoE
MIEIILVRHGETDWNIAEVFRGRIDIELNETGRKQAELLSEYLKDSNISAIYSSPLKRAFKTAEIIASHHSLDVEIAPGLIDFDYGEWQGLSHEVVKDLYKELYFEWNKNPHQVKMPAGESLNDVRGRVSSVIDSIVTRNEGTIVLVAHRVVNKVLICFLLGLDNSHFWNIKQDACGITTFTCENKRFVLIKHNDISFLGLMPKAHFSDF